MTQKTALVLSEDQILRVVRLPSEEPLAGLVGRLADPLGETLAAILARIETAHGELEAGRPLLAELSGIELAARRAAGLTLQILASLRPQETQESPKAFPESTPPQLHPLVQRGSGGVRNRRPPGDLASLGANLTQALKGFWMAYQPIVSFRERRVFGYEALLRCSGPVFRTVDDLLHAAQRLGRLRELGRAIRERISSEASRVPEGAKLFVNVHPLDLTDDRLYEIRSELFEISDRTVLEITEQASLDGIEDLACRVARLRAMGFQIAMDDLGAGYAGLANYSVLEPDIVKIDMSLVRNIDREPRKQSIVRSMTNLCSELGTVVVAEGIETPEERDTLVGLGCDLLQGFLFARPGRFFGVPEWGPETVAPQGSQRTMRALGFLGPPRMTLISS